MIGSVKEVSPYSCRCLATEGKDGSHNGGEKSEVLHVDDLDEFFE